MNRSLDLIRRHRTEKTLLDANRKISEQVLRELADAGYWGLLVSPEHGGTGAPFASFARFLTKMATIEPTVAGLASVHGCIGAVDPVRTFGTPEQKARLLPILARGERLSAFALTEPGAGSDLTALRTTAVLDGDDYVVNGEKLFITNAVPGRTVGLVCLIDGKPAVLIADLPDHEDEHFRIVPYGLYALKEGHNNGMVFRDFRVPRANLLQPSRGDGLTIAYHGLNLGRVALCATAAGTMRVMLANMLPWASFRKTYGAPIATRELVRRRIGRLAALIVGCDALVEWCSGLLDQGYRGEMECIIAKIFGSESQKEAAIELFMKTHGGRAFLHGHLFGDNVHEYLAPCIYEGEGEILGLGFFKSLIKEHGKTFFEPIGRTLQASGIRNFNPMNPRHAWTLRKAIAPYVSWRVKQTLARPRPEVPKLPAPLDEHARFAIAALQGSRLEVSDVMSKHQLKLADRQCRMSEVSQRLQDMVVMLTTSCWAGGQSSEVVRDAADVLCQDLRRKLTGQAAERRLLPRGHEARQEGRGGGLRGHRRDQARGHPDALCRRARASEARTRRGGRLGPEIRCRGGFRTRPTILIRYPGWCRAGLKPAPTIQTGHDPRHGGDMSQAFQFEEIDGGIGLITFDAKDKKVNTFSQPVLAELMGLVGRLEGRSDLRGLLLRSGKPGQFIAGADLNEIGALVYATKEQLAQSVAFGHQLFGRVSRLPFPTVALIDGNCMGGGTELVLAMDERLASASPQTKIALPEVKIGIIPGWGGTQRLPRLIGLNAIEMICTGEPVSAAKAVEIGLVFDAVPAERLVEEGIRLDRDHANLRRLGGRRGGAGSSPSG